MRKHLHEQGGGLIMTPMIDIVFQLIAFFIFSLSYSADRPSAAVAPPEAQLGEQFASDSLLLEIDRQGRLLTGEGPLAASDPTFPARVQALLDEVGAEQTVVIRADRDLPFAVVDQVLELCRAHRFRSVVLRLRVAQS